jgi:hypothetical protein
LEPGDQQHVIAQGFQEQGSLMVVRVLCALALCLLQVEAARAEERGGLMRRVSCTIVRYYVAKYSAPGCLGGAAGQALQAANLNAR